MLGLDTEVVKSGDRLPDENDDTVPLPETLILICPAVVVSMVVPLPFTSCLLAGKLPVSSVDVTGVLGPEPFEQSANAHGVHSTNAASSPTVRLGRRFLQKLLAGIKKSSRSDVTVGIG